MNSITAPKSALDPTITLTYKFTARLSRQAHADLDKALALNRELYNAANQERRDAFSVVRRGATPERISLPLFPSKAAQSKGLTALRSEIPELAAQDRRIAVGTLERIDKAWQAVWRNRKAGRKARLPRYKSAHRFRTLEIYAGANNYLQPAGVRPGRYRLRIKGLPSIRFDDKNGRIPADTQPLIIRIVRKPKRVEVQCVYAINCAPAVVGDGGIGLDMGVASQATTSDGSFYSKRIIDRRRLKRISRRMARQRKAALSDRRAHMQPIGGGRVRFVWDKPSRSYEKTRRSYAREWQSQTEREVNAAHRVSADVVRKARSAGVDTIAVEDLRIQNMLFNHRLARAIAEQGWGRLIGMLRYKAEKAGMRFAAVSARNTSQTCSACGAVLEKKLKLSKREFVCPACGHIADRDENAALNVLRRALDARGGGETLPRRPVDKFRTPLGGEDAEIRSVLWAITKRGRVKRRPAAGGENAQMGFAFG